MPIKFHYFFLLIAGLFLQCTRPEETLIPINTSLSLKTVHHDVPAVEVNVFIKYNVLEFPGYDKQPEYFDTMLVSDNDGRVKLNPVRPGQHWAVAFGASEHGIVVPIYGSMPFLIDVDNHPAVDTFIYMTE